MAGLVAGPLIDRMGVRRSLVLGSLLACVGMFAFALAFTRAAMLLALLVGMPLGLAFGLPVVDIGCKRYTFAGDRKLAFGLTYSAMNVGAAVAGLSFDALRSALDAPHGGRWRVSTTGYEASAERLLVLSAACATAVAGLLAALLVRDVTRTREGGIALHRESVATALATLSESAENGDGNNGADDNDALFADDNDFVRLESRRDSGTGVSGSNIGCCRRMYISTRLYMRATVGTRIFWQLVLFTSVMLPVRQVFRQLDATLPKWALRVLGPDAPIGSLYAINPSTIVFLAPIAALVFSRFDLYSVITGGATLSALSVFVLGAHPTVATVSLALFLFTLGEAIYSPQVVTFIMALAPDRSEGAYTSLANAPTFLSKILVGAMSGGLLANYCPHALSSYDDPPLQKFSEDSHGAPMPPPLTPALQLANETGTAVANLIGESVGATLTLLANATATTPAAAATTAAATPAATPLLLAKPRHAAERDCATVWFVIAGVAVFTPVLLVLVRRCVYTERVKHALSVRTQHIKLDEVERE
jgi:MFS family permease